MQPSGRVVVPFFGLCSGTMQFCAITSDDGGNSWTAPTVIAARMFHGTQPAFRSPPLPSAAIDRDGRIYLVWKDCRFEGCQPPANRKPPNWWRRCIGKGRETLASLFITAASPLERPALLSS